MNGGYCMIDCTGLDLTKGSTAQTISGLYNKVLTSMGCNKPVYAYNCAWGDIGIMSPIQVMCLLFAADEYIIATASTLQIVITKSDVVTINNLAPQA